MDLFEDGSDSEVKFTINKDYANRYDKWRQGEELQKLKNKYGEDFDSGSSSSEDEDENARELTKDIEKDFFRTLSCLKVKDPKIYDQNIKFFKSQPSDASEETKGKDKTKKNDHFYSLGEYQRKLLIEKKGQLSDEEDENVGKELTNAEEERALKKSFVNALKDSESEDEDCDWGGIFKKRKKTTEELEAEEEDYKLWLAGQKTQLANSKEENELKGLHDFWSNPQLDENEQFLRDYILNKRFLEKDSKNNIPTYDEIVHDSDSALSDDETALQKQEEFERKYNFRFEEPDQEFIKRYPRTLEHSIRKKDDKRKRHREEVKVRKQAEKAKKAEELKRLKILKRKEIIEKIKKLQEITGNEDMGFEHNDIEGDFDPDDHDKRMSEIFNEEYYGDCGDEEKPEYPDLDKELEIENWDEWGGENGENGEEEEELHCEDPGFNMDCDYEPNANKETQNELVQMSKKHKKRRQSKFSAAVARKKPLFDPNDKSFEKYIDEYYSLDYEDLIGDLPCRFKYRKVVPNDFGLSVEEILSAPDKELNSWVSVKKIMQRRPEHVELYDVKAYKKKAENFNKKKKCLPSIYGTLDEGPSTNPNNLENNNLQDCNLKNFHKIKNKTEKNNHESQNVDQGFKKSKHKNKQKDLGAETNFSKSNEFSLNNKKRKNKKEFKDFKSKTFQKDIKDKDSELVYNIPDSRLKSYGINPKKLKNKLKWKSKDNVHK